MSYEAVGKLVDKWLNDAGFRKALREDAEKTVRRSGLELSPEEWATLRGIDWRMTDEELKTRITKGM
ncbi:MAG: hypothetical protein HYS22_05345 [Deltaproteobacteria bacterium]|nr:hypothetical protein [Deltaproteobacteria bacterium]